MKKPKAFLFDLNGTMIDDMIYHLDIWYDLLVNELGATLSREEVKYQMYGRNDELLIRVFGADRFSAEEIEAISYKKEVMYQDRYRPHLKLLPGLSSFMAQAAAAGIKLGIGSAAIPFNIDFVVDELDIRHYFKAIVSAQDVTKSKPHPQTYLMGADLLHVEPSACVVFEDAPKGVETAANAGMKAVVVTTTHPEEDFRQYDNVIRFIKDFSGLVPYDLLVK